jgi:hypothetical protein
MAASRERRKMIPLPIIKILRPCFAKRPRKNMYLIHPSGQLLRFSGWQKAGGTCVACKLSRNIEINLAEVPGGGNFRFKFSNVHYAFFCAT